MLKPQLPKLDRVLTETELNTIYLRLDAANDPMQADLDMGNNALNNVSSLVVDIIKPATNAIDSLTFTQADGVTDIMSIDTLNQRVGINTMAPTDLLTVNGNLRVTSTLKVADGSLTAGSIAHRGDENTSLYFPANGIMAMVSDGVEKIRVDNNNVYLYDTVQLGANNLITTGQGQFGQVVIDNLYLNDNTIQSVLTGLVLDSTAGDLDNLSSRFTWGASTGNDSMVFNNQYLTLTDNSNSTNGIYIDNGAVNGDPILGFKLSGTIKGGLGIDDSDSDALNLFYGTSVANPALSIYTSGISLRKDTTLIKASLMYSPGTLQTGSTPKVGGGNVWRTSNTSPTSITNFQSGSDGEMIIVIGNDNGNTTITNSATIALSRTRNYVLENDTSITLEYDGARAKWVEISRQDYHGVYLPLTGGTLTGNVTLENGVNIIAQTGAGTKIGTATTQKLGFFNATPIVRPTALTTALTTITYTAPSTPDYALQDITNSSPYGFVDAEELRTFISVVKNLQDRVNDLETKLQSLGLIA